MAKADVIECMTLLDEIAADAKSGMESIKESAKTITENAQKWQGLAAAHNEIIKEVLADDPAMRTRFNKVWAEMRAIYAHAMGASADTNDMAMVLLGKMTRINALMPSVAKTLRAKESAEKALEADRHGKQAAKANALKLWQDWQTGKTLHKSGAAFARFVCDEYPVLESPTNVERWVRKWKAEKVKTRH